MTSILLCKITFYLDQNEQQNNIETASDHKVKHSINVYSNMSMYQITMSLCQLIGCDYQQFIEIQIQTQLIAILKDGSGNNIKSMSQVSWETQMNKILQTFGKKINLKKQLTQYDNFQSTSELSQKRTTSRYFQTSFDKFFRNNTQKKFINHNKQNQLNIYQRSIRMRKKTQQKLQALKTNKINEQIENCTFTPQISDTFQFFHKKNPKFFNQNSNQNNKKQTRFQKLYKQSIDLREKKKQRIKTLENQEQQKLLELSFIPNINQCSKQICKKKSYASFVLDNKQKDNKQKQITNCKNKVNELKKNNESIKKSQNAKMNCTFHPKLSQNTKKLTQNLPSFYERLQIKNQKNKKQKQKNIINESQYSTLAQKIIIGKTNSQGKVKKEVYIIDDTQNQNQNQRQSNLSGNANLAVKYQQPKIQQQLDLLDRKHEVDLKKTNTLNRSHELFNNHKKVTFKAIFNFLSLQHQIRLPDFNNFKKINSKAKKKQINMNDITEHPYIPNFVKELFYPLSEELGELDVSLNQEQFIWAMEKLFEGLDLADKGSLLGWGVKLLPEQIKQTE